MSGFSNLVLVRFSNRLLTLSSQSAARRKKSLSYEKAWNLAGAVCMEQGYGKEPMALKGNRIALVGRRRGPDRGVQGDRQERAGIPRSR